MKNSIEYHHKYFKYNLSFYHIINNYVLDDANFFKLYWIFLYFLLIIKFTLDLAYLSLKSIIILLLAQNYYWFFCFYWHFFTFFFKIKIFYELKIFIFYYYVTVKIFIQCDFFVNFFQKWIVNLWVVAEFVIFWMRIFSY